MINLVVCVAQLPESLDPTKRRPVRWPSLPGRRARAASADAAVDRARRQLLLTNLANHALYATWVFSTTMRFGWSTVTVGIVFAVMGVGFAVAQGLRSVRR